MLAYAADHSFESEPMLSVSASRHTQAGSVAEAEPGYLDQDVSRFFYRWGGHLSATLVRVRARFDGDLDQYLLYLVFVLTDLAQAMSEGALDPAQPPQARQARRGLNALSLSDITRIPRETARRKLLALAEHGYLHRDEAGLFFLAERYSPDQVFADLRPLFWDGLKA